MLRVKLSNVKSHLRRQKIRNIIFDISLDLKRNNNEFIINIIHYVL